MIDEMCCVMSLFHILYTCVRSSLVIACSFLTSENLLEALKLDFYMLLSLKPSSRLQLLLNFAISIASLISQSFFFSFLFITVVLWNRILCPVSVWCKAMADLLTWLFLQQHICTFFLSSVSLPVCLCNIFHSYIVFCKYLESSEFH